MRIAFAILFFVFVGLCELLRLGFIGLSHSETSGITYGALAVCAVLILRSDVIYTMYCPDHALYGNERFSWIWSRSVLGLFLGPVIWMVPAAFGFALMQINVSPVVADVLFRSVLVQVLLVGFAEGLFFREAAIKAFGEDTLALYVVSALAVFNFYIPTGVPQAVIAAAAGLYFLTLRLIGTNILVVALVHGVTVVLFGQVISLGLTQADMWSYAAYFAVASAALSLMVFTLFSNAGKEPEYA